MKENKNVQSVFKFVTVRGPKKKVFTALREITYDGKSKFLKALKTASEMADETKKSNKLSQLSGSFADGETFLSDESALVELVGQDLLSFAEWLSVNLDDLSKQKVSQRLKTVNSQLDNKKREVLWDHLFHGALIGKTNSVLYSIMQVIVANHFISNYNKAEITDDPRPLDETLRALAQTEIVLPGPFPFNPSHLSSPASTGASKQDQAPPEDPGKLVEQYKAAITELETYAGRQWEIAKNKAITQGSDSDAAVSSSSLGMVKDFKTLSGETQKVLKELKATPDLSISYLIDELTAEAAKATAKQFKQANLSNKVVAAGGALWSPDPTNNSGNTELKRTRHDGTPDDYDGFYYDDGKCRIKPLGIADYRRVEQELCCYKPGEVAHIENILQGEYKERATRRLRRKEETFTVSSESEEVRERDTVSTDRYEMQKETEKVIQNDMSFELGTSVSGSYGPVTMSVNAGFAISSSTTQSDKQAVTYAKEVTERALDRVVKRTKEERVTKMIEEFEENNKHGLDNRAGDKHVVGLYRWADKIYKAQVVNYGKRLMFEFMVAEPGAFHLWAMSGESSTATGIVLEEPVDPRSDKMAAILGTAYVKHNQIDDTNYGELAALYGAQVEPPPQTFRAVEKSYSREKIDDPVASHFSKEYNDLKVPEGYDVEYAYVRAQIDLQHTGWVVVHVGEVSASFNGSAGNNNSRQGFAMFMYNEQETIPVCVMGRTSYYGVTINIYCKRSAKLYEEWQIKTYAAILGAYENQKARYEQALAEASVQKGVNIQGTNPAMNRIIEQQELKKQCLNWLYNGADFSSDSVSHQITGGPVWDTDCDAVKAGEEAKFMEQCFEWNLMTYKFLPYFYGARSRWKKLYQLNDSDPQFLSFLQAGMARVLVPVRPGFEKQTMHFLRTGQVWGGEHVPAINSPIYLSIVDELKEPLGTVEGEPWEVRIPTSLTVLQCESGCVEGKGLPCDCDPDNGFGSGTGGILTPVITGSHDDDDHTHDDGDDHGGGTTTTGGGTTTTGGGTTTTGTSTGITTGSTIDPHKDKTGGR